MTPGGTGLLLEGRIMRLFFASMVAIAGAAPVLAQDKELEPKEYTVPWEKTRPRDPIMDKAGRVWFVGQVGNYVAYLDSRSGEFKKYTIEDGTGPHNINLDERGGVWFTGNRNNRIVQLIPETGELKTHMIPDSTVRDPHTMIWGKDGIAWFTAQQSQRVGRFDRKTGEIKLWRPSQPRSNPYGIVLNSKGQPFFDLFATNRIGTIDPKSLEYKEYVLPSDRARPRRIAITSDDMVWYGDFVRGFLGRLDPKTGAVEEWQLPEGANTQPYAMTVDDKDRLWLAETGAVQPNRLVAFDPQTKQWVANVPVPANGSMASTIRHMTFDRTTRQIWFGTDAGTIGAIKVPSELRKLTP
jgi:virginiamycin B lyase